MLIAKGFSAQFIMQSGAKHKAPSGYALLHDPSGKDWPRCSALVAPFSKTSQEITSKEAKSYFGFFSSAPRAGKITLPPKELSRWRQVGQVDEILYTRQRPIGLRASNQGKYYHPFEGKAVLYKLGRMYRVELAKGCVWNARGIVKP